MIFICKAYPNAVIEGCQFKNGKCDISDPDKIEALKKNPFVKAKSMDPTKTTKTKGYIIPSSWTLKQIKAFAKENNIQIPRDIRTKKEITDYLESL